MTKKMTKAKATPEPVSELEIFYDIEQGSDEWFEVRKGIPTASNFATVMAEGRDGGPSLTRTKYLYRLAGEIITGLPAEDGYRSVAMDRGIAMEDEARQSYCRRKNVEPRRIGFGRNFSGLRRCGASPDSLIGFDGGLEIKTARPDILIPMLLQPARMPPEHRYQVHGSIYVFERDWWDVTVYADSKLAAMDVRVYRDDALCKELDEGIQRFNWDLQKLVERLRKMGAAG